MFSKAHFFMSFLTNKFLNDSKDMRNKTCLIL